MVLNMSNATPVSLDVNAIWSIERLAIRQTHGHCVIPPTVRRLCKNQPRRKNINANTKI